MLTLPGSGPCPCGGGRYQDCCGPLHRRERDADGPEPLMRSRYAAYAVSDRDHLFRTWHPRTRPADLSIDPELTWVGLEIHGSGTEGDRGWVEFTARFRHGGRFGELREHSVFQRRRGRWVYVEPAVEPAP